MTINMRDVGSGYKRTSINSNFQDIETEINNNLLSKNGGVGLEADLDANSQKVINLADGILGSDAVNLRQLNGAINAAGSGLIASQTEVQLGSEAVANVFTLSSITYTVGGNNLYVFRNGQKLGKGEDYTETSTSSITLTFTPNANDRFEFITNISTTNSTTDTSAITHSQYGRTLNLDNYLVNRYIASVKDFGAIGDGITDDTLAIQAAVDASSHIYFPPGTYIVRENGGASCIALKDNLTIFGAGIGVSSIKRKDSDVNSSRIMYGVGVENVTVTDLTLDGNIANQNQTYEQQHAFMVTRNGAGNGSKYIKLTRVEAKDTVGDGYFFHLESEDCHMTDCIADNNLRVGANVGFVRGCTIRGCVFRNIRTNGIKTEPNDPGNIARNITITGNIFHAAASPTGTLGGVTLGSPITAEVNGVTITGNNFYNLDFPVLLSKAAKNVVVSGNTMRECRSICRALSFTSALGDIQENILVENNVGYDILHTGTSDQYLFAFYNAKNVVCRNNIVHEKTGGALSRFGDFRECDDVTVTGNRIKGDAATNGLVFLNCEKVDIQDNVLELNDATKSVIVFDNTTAPTIPLVYAKIKDNVFLGTYSYGINLGSMSDTDTIDEAGNKYLGAYTSERLSATAAKYNNLYESGDYSITSGTGAPSGAPLGDRGIYIREDGGTSTTLYVWEGIAWVAK